MRKMVFLIIAILILQNIYCLKNNKKGIEGYNISTEDFSFENDKLLKIFDDKNNIIGYYEKFEIKTILILNLTSIKVYNQNKELICLIIPLFDGNRFLINLKNKDGKISQINLIQQASELKVVGGYFDKAYEFNSLINFHSNNTREVYNNIYLNDKKILFQEIIYDNKGKINKKTIIDENFYKENLEDTIILTIIFKNINEFRGMQ